ncbi:ATP-binding protein [uncultured Propionivibrio sp.]|uniref:ATP-binding protein n=1 Tax=uncultured Propionivibrio sp. TaxID=426737 RepID=UPI0029C0D2CC|nr:ATP-binding protein [uncultured Propionivibrio sp.]
MNENDIDRANGKKAHTILIIDDEPIFLEALGELLNPHYHVRAANSGQKALQALATEPTPDLVLLDVLMPDIDGFDVLRQLKENDATADIPVLFITALHDEDTEQRGLEMGAADYIHKPLKGLIVLSRIRAQLEARAAREMLRKNNLMLKNQVSQDAQAIEQVQRQLLQAEKMSAMGQLAAGIAHEINNPVGYIGSNLNTLETYLKDIFSLVDAYENGVETSDFSTARAQREAIDYSFVQQDTMTLLFESKAGVERVRKIVSDLRDFSRISDTDWEWSDLHRGLESTLNIVRNELKYHCTVVKHYGELPLVRCLSSQINQVFINLLVNASQAIEGSGTITITTEAFGPDQVRVMIEDTGKGIAPEAIDKIFEPFFTTKPVGKGTGLGLSLSKGIVERHHGTLTVASAPGKGATFTMTLPVDASPQGRNRS